MGFLLWCSVAALMFPTTLHMVQLFIDKKIQMLRQDVFFALKWQADCQFSQLVILYKGRKRSLIITIYFVWTLLCNRLSTWEPTGMNCSMRLEKDSWESRFLQRRRTCKTGQSTFNRNRYWSIKEISPLSITFPMALSGRQNFLVWNRRTLYTMSAPLSGPRTL